MSSTRKNFIKQVSAATLAGVSLQGLAKSSHIQQITAFDKTIAHDDESYWQTVRQLFPLTKDLAYLNNGTMGPSPYPVIEAMRRAMMDCDQLGNYGGWEATATKLAKFVKVNDDEIALTHNVTEGINIACWGLPLKKGDEVIMTTHEHVGGAFPWLNRRKLHGIVIKTFTPASTASETLNLISSLINKKTRAIVVPHIPCTQGQILPAKEICKLAKDKGLYSIIDGAHGAGMMPLNLHDMGCDVYASCCHKWMLGPKGTGFLYVRKDFQDTLQPYFVGGGSDNAKWNMMAAVPEMGDYAPSAHRYYGATQSIGLYKGVEASIDFIETIGQENIYNRIKALGKYAQDQLLQHADKLDVITPTEEQSRCSIIGFKMKTVEYMKFYNTCAENKVRIRAVHENGLDSLRVSTHIYNTTNDVDKLIDLIKKI
jgi:L-cysteine/cystine lyase